MAWRGDSVELDLLNYLGSLYLQNNQPVDALVRWREAVNQNQSGSLVLASQMSKVFTDLFLHDQPVALNAFDKVSLYFEFQELTPIGKMGDQIIEDLVDSLLQLDLLPRAEQLLSHLISNRVEGAERDRMITKLADVYLQDNKASDMLALLEQPPQAELSAEVLEHRRNLKIEGFLKMRQTEQALALIGEREDWDSRIKRVEVYWSLSDWGQVIDLIEPMQEVWADADVPLDKTQAALLAQLAAAHSMQNHNAEVSFLFKTFSPLLTDQPLVKKAMNFLAHNNRKINSNALAKTVGVSTMEDFMKNFANIMADIAIQKAY